MTPLGSRNATTGTGSTPSWSSKACAKSAAKANTRRASTSHPCRSRQACSQPSCAAIGPSRTAYIGFWTWSFATMCPACAPITRQPISAPSNTWRKTSSDEPRETLHCAKNVRPQDGMTTSSQASSQYRTFTRFPCLCLRIFSRCSGKFVTIGRRSLRPSSVGRPFTLWKATQGKVPASECLNIPMGKKR